MAKCTKCGAEVQDGATFCDKCGTPMTAQQADYGWDRSMAQQNGPENKGALRFLSLLFAIGLLIFAVGLGGHFFYDRQADSAIRESAEEYHKELSDDELKEAKESFSKELAFVLKSDVKGLLKEEGATDEDIKNLSDDTLNYLRDNLKEINKKGQEEFGFLWTLLKAGARSSLLMIIGGALAVLALIIWLARGGTSAPLSQTTMAPAVCILVILAAVAVVACLFLIAPGKDFINKVSL